MKPSFRLPSFPNADLLARAEIPVARGVVLRGWEIRRDSGGKLTVHPPRVAVTQAGGILALEPGLFFENDEVRQQWEERVLTHYKEWLTSQPSPADITAKQPGKGPKIQAESASPARPRKPSAWTVQFDGGSRGNPGPAASGAVVMRPGLPVLECQRYLGRRTNNVAEYTAVLLALERIAELPPHERPTRVLFQGDSQLVVRQLEGEWRIKDPTLGELARQIELLIDTLEINASFEWIPRAKNSDADALVNRCLDEQIE